MLSKKSLRDTPVSQVRFCFYIDNNTTAQQPTAIPIHCHHLIFSLKTNIENSIVIINPPTDKTGYTKLGERGETAKRITKKLFATLLSPERIGKCAEVFNTVFTSPFSLQKKRIIQKRKAKNVAKHII